MNPKLNDEAATGSAPCPTCSHLQPSGTFRTHPMEKPPLKAFRVQSERDGSAMNHGDYDTLEMARAGACGSDAVILTRDDGKTTKASKIRVAELRRKGQIVEHHNKGSSLE